MPGLGLLVALSACAGTATEAPEPSPFVALRELGVRSPAAAATTAAEGLASPTPRVQPVDAASISPPPPADPDTPFELAVAALRGPAPETGVRALRQELARGDQPAEAALVLADHLARDERVFDALVVIDTGLERRPERLDLELARARLLMDLGSYRPAVSLLRELGDREPGHPRVGWMLVTAEREQGHRGAARVELEALRARHADHPWVVARAASLAAMAEELSAEDAPRGYTTRELLNTVRSADSAVVRVRALRTLAAAEAPELAAALRIAMADSEPLLRLSALHAGLPVVVDRTAWLRAGLQDSAPQVRGLAARLSPALVQRESIPLLMSFLDEEHDGYVVGQMHQALIEITGRRPGFTLSDEAAAAELTRLRNYWHQQVVESAQWR